MNQSAKKTVAIIGASADRAKFGNISVRSHLAAGYDVYPVHPREAAIEGLRAYKSVAEIPVDLDRISLYVPPQVGIGLLEEIARKGCRELFVNPGSESDELLKQARRLGLAPIQACSIIAAGGFV